MKRPHPDNKFSIQCPNCAAAEIVYTKIDYSAEVKHDGRVECFVVTDLLIPICKACGENIFTDEVDRQIFIALRKHLKLLPPEEIRKAITSLGLSQRKAAERLGIAEATLSRWLNESVIQSRSMDNLLRLYFFVPEARSMLNGETSELSGNSTGSHGAHEKERLLGRNPRNADNKAKGRPSEWRDKSIASKKRYNRTQELIATSRTSWGVGVA